MFEYSSCLLVSINSDALLHVALQWGLNLSACCIISSRLQRMNVWWHANTMHINIWRRRVSKSTSQVLGRWDGFILICLTPHLFLKSCVERRCDRVAIRVMGSHLNKQFVLAECPPFLLSLPATHTHTHTGSCPAIDLLINEAYTDSLSVQNGYDQYRTSSLVYVSTQMQFETLLLKFLHNFGHENVTNVHIIKF